MHVARGLAWLPSSPATSFRSFVSHAHIRPGSTIFQMSSCVVIQLATESYEAFKPFRRSWRLPNRCLTDLQSFCGLSFVGLNSLELQCHLWD